MTLIAMKWLGLALLLLLAGPTLAWLLHDPPEAPWHQASRKPAGLAPDPAAHRAAVVQVYVARLFGMRGAFGVHSWIAVKPRDAAAYTVLEVTGWRHWSGSEALHVRTAEPDRYWFGNRPEVVADLRDDDAEPVVRTILAAAGRYPFRASYKLWPGPNSNTFTAYIGREVPELSLDLPPTAIGKDYLGPGLQLARSPSNTGWQVSLHGLVSLLAAREEGLELSLLGLTYGIDPLGLAVKLPGLGRIGVPEASERR